MADWWSSFALDPRQRAHAALRASDDDRERVVALLASAYADGRLTRDELDERTEAAAAARTLGDLPPLVDDLVAPALAPSRSGSLVAMSSEDIYEHALETWRTRRRGALFAFLSVLIISGGVALFLELWWPLVFAALSLLNVTRVISSRDETVRAEVRRIEKKQARQQRWPRGLP